METKEEYINNRVKQFLPDDEYRIGIKNIIDNEVKKIIELDIQQAAKELIEQQKEGIREIVEEYRFIIHLILEEEKKAMAVKAEELRRSILKFGLEDDE